MAATEAGGTHPAGMHSCTMDIFIQSIMYYLTNDFYLKLCIIICFFFRSTKWNLKATLSLRSLLQHKDSTVSKNIDITPCRKFSKFELF